MPKFTRKTFFNGFRQRIDPTIEQGQIDGLEFLLSGFETDDQWKDLRHIAYALATIFHETAGSFQPVEEGYYLGERKAKAHQKTLRYFPYFGRGYVQLTWKANYEKAAKAIGRDLVNHPEVALESLPAFDILTLGLFRGWFGGKLTTYINDTKCDYVNARRCVNKLDKAGLIAGYAVSFEKILRASLAKDSTAATANAPASTASLGATTSDGPAATNTAVDNNQPPPERPPAPPEKVAVEREPDPDGFLKRKWRQITGGIAGIGGIQTLKENADTFTFLGLSAEAWQWIVGLAIGAFLVWLLGSLFIEKIWEPLKSRWLTTSLIHANSTPTNLVTVAACDKLEDLEKQGYIIVRRA